MLNDIVQGKRVLLVDSSTSGHHARYAHELLRAGTGMLETCYIIAGRQPDDDLATHVCAPDPCGGLRAYMGWLSDVLDYANDQNADIVHFLYGDVFYRYFGLGLGRFPMRVVVTLHQFDAARHPLVRRTSMCCIARQADACVSHTESVLDMLPQGRRGTDRVITYPAFETYDNEVLEPEVSRQEWGVAGGPPVLLALGGTRRDKGLDLLLESLGLVKRDFMLLVAGREEDVTIDEIRELSSSYSDRVRVHLRFLSEGELVSAVSASDIVVLPYRDGFNGASGPMTLGASLGKTIVGPDHGGLGDCIRRNHLGYTFRSGNRDSLVAALDAALGGSFSADETYRRFADGLDPSVFVNEYRGLYERLLSLC